MSNANMKIVDKNDLDAILLPKIKDETEEIVLPPIRRDILPRSADVTPYFPLDFGMEDIVIDTVSRKYLRGEEHYHVDDQDEEHFLLGVKACRDGIKKLNCPYLKKALVRLRDSDNFPWKSLTAMYLLNVDDGEENRQEFLAMTKDGFYLFAATPEIRYLPFDDLVFTAEGIDSSDRAPSFEEHLLTYAFDDDFLDFLHEFSLLRNITLADIRESHPFVQMQRHDLVKDFLRGKDDFLPIMPAADQRNAYLCFLVDVATAEGKTDAKTMLRLIYMAREFHVTADSLAGWLRKIYRDGGIRKNKLTEELARTLSFLGTAEQRTAFYQDVIEVAMGDDGEFHRPQLLKIIKGSQFAGEKFVDAYMDFVAKRKKAEIVLEKTWRLCEKKDIRLPNAMRMQNYNNRLNLQITMMGAMTNE